MKTSHALAKRTGVSEEIIWQLIKIYSDILVTFHNLFNSGKWKLMVFKKVDISGHFVDFFFYLLELWVNIFVVSIELSLTLDTLFLLFSFDWDFVHDVYLLYRIINKKFVYKIILYFYKDGKKDTCNWNSNLKVN